MKLVIISGLSGSGKTIALHTLEDENFYCVDNFPLGLLPDFVKRILKRNFQPYDNVAVGVDARSEANDLKNFSSILKKIREHDIDIEIIYLHADLTTLIKRFSESRRKHPLTRKGLPLSEAVEIERSLLSSVSSEADLFIDSTYTNLHQLRDLVKKRVVSTKKTGLSLLFQSFGFKHGTPVDSDYVFDVRCLPNPYWEPKLRRFTGKDLEVVEFLQEQNEVQEMFDFIRDFLETWIPRFEKQNRYYLTVSIGCTGGQHRSVYISEKLCNEFSEKFNHVSVRHRELE